MEKVFLIGEEFAKASKRLGFIVDDSLLINEVNNWIDEQTNFILRKRLQCGLRVSVQWLRKSGKELLKKGLN